MFKKRWKLTKIFILLIINFFFYPCLILAKQTDNAAQDEMQVYRNQNEAEQRLIDYKDNDEALKLKVIQLDIINNSRKKFNAPPVKLDILASRVANKMAREAAENGYIGHWNMAGEEPYLRYAFAGGYDHISENAYGERSSTKYNKSPSLIGSLMKKGHEKFMSERPPDDGHKQNITEKSHNYVGIGFCLSGKQFRYYEEFIDRYFEFENIPPEVKVGGPCSITIKTDGQRYLYYVIIFRERWPKHLTPSQINKRGSYRDYTNEEYEDLVASDLSRFRKGNVYEIPLRFSKEGFFYIQAFSDKKEIIRPASLSTKGKTPESGIVIKVER